MNVIAVYVFLVFASLGSARGFKRAGLMEKTAGF